MQVNIKQNTSEWLEFRKNKIGASEASVILGINPWKTPYQLWKEKLNIDPPQLPNESMKLGIESEKKARNLFIEETGIDVEPKVFLHDEHRFMMASLDGISKDGKTAVEIKCPGERSFFIAKKGVIPEYYTAQMQHQMYVCNLDQIFYFVYFQDECCCNVVERDEKYIEKIIDLEKEFYDCLMEFEPPPFVEKDFLNMENSKEWKELSLQLKMIKNNMNFLENLEKETRDKLIKLSGNTNAQGHGIRLSKVVKRGTVQYQQIPEIKNINLDNYRSKTSAYWKIQFSG